MAEAAESTYFWSPTTAAFYLNSLRPAYEAAGSWPADGVAVTDAVFLEFGATAAPSGKMRGADSSGAPAWVDAIGSLK